METRTINVYSFTELSDKAKARAVHDDQLRCDWVRAREYMNSLEALAAYFGGKLKTWEIDWSNSSCPSSAVFEMPAAASGKEIRKLLRALGTFDRRTLKGHGDCKLTGVCTDESAIDGFRWAFYREKERSLDALMQAAFQMWIKTAWADYEYDYGEGYAETTEANEWRYYEDGRMVPRKGWPGGPLT